MKNNRNLRRMFIFTIVFCTCVAAFTFHLAKDITNNFFDCFGQDQQVLLNEVSRQLKNSLTSSELEIDAAEKNAVDHIVKRVDSSNSRYWIFATTENILYINNDKTTDLYRKSSINDLLDEYKDVGGKNIKDIEELIANKMRGNVLYSVSKDSATLILSLDSFQVKDKTYFIGVTTTEQYIFSITDILKNRIYLYALVGLLCAILLVVLTLSMLIIQQKDKKLAECYSIVRTKNRQVAYLNQINSKPEIIYLNNPEERKPDDDRADVYDKLTDIYSKQFYYAILDNALELEITPTSVILIHIIIPAEIISTGIIKHVVDVLKSFEKDNYIISRTKFCEFTMVLVRTDLRSANAIATKIMKKMNHELKRVSFEIEVKTIEKANESIVGKLLD